ncbi:hypothetical protein ACU16_19240 [Xanthomonas oryzae pv. oryzicola]|nr:hypothetical protein BE73_02685 [Xanthomonas oryzae pv. oryzicola]AKO05918.1 hypothetical protein ACU16_19240 [Xanthomonas oryzae pv. oryzicola]
MAAAAAGVERCGSTIGAAAGAILVLAVIAVSAAGNRGSPDPAVWKPSCPGAPVTRCGEGTTAAGGDGTGGAGGASISGAGAGGNAETGAGGTCSDASAGGTTGVGISNGAAGVARRNVARGRCGGGVSDIGRRAAGRPLFNHAHVVWRTRANGWVVNP